MPDLGVLFQGSLSSYLTAAPNLDYCICRHTNFRTFNEAIYTLTRVSLGGEWVWFAKDLSVMPPYCTIDSDVYDCGSVFPRTYFVSFLSIVCFVVIEMVVAVILENFTWMYAMNKTLFNKHTISISSNDLEDFKDLWEEFDPRRTGSISMMQLGPFLTRLKEDCPPLNIYEGTVHVACKNEALTSRLT